MRTTKLKKINKISLIASLLVTFLIGFNSLILAVDEVDLMLDWVPNTNHTGLYVALDKGWFEEEGLKVNFIQPASNMSVEKVVGAGKADFGISFQEWATSAMAQGVPIVSLAAVIQHNTSEFASLASNGIERPRNLTGKSYGGWGMPIEEAIIKSLVNGDNGDFSKIKFINIGQGDLLTMLEKEKFDFTWIYYGWDGIQAEIRGMDLNLIMLKDYQEYVPDYYTPIIISSHKFVDNHPDIARRFIKAVARGYNFAIANPGPSAEILMKYTPESNPDLVKKSQNWLSPRYQDDAAIWGIQKQAVWQDFGDWMYEHGLIENKFEAESAFTNDFLPEMTGDLTCPAS